MVSTFLGLGLLSTLAIAVLPVPRVRRWLLIACARLVQAVVLAVLGACGTFFVQPQAAPSWVGAALYPFIEGTESLLPTATAAVQGLPWLVLAVVAVGVSLPILIVVELAASLTSQSALVQSLRKEIGAAANWFDRRLAMLGVAGPSFPVLTNEAQHAGQALRSGSGTRVESAGPLVLDLLKK